MNIKQIVFKLEKSQTNNNSNNVTLEIEDNPNADVSIYDTFFTDDATDVYFENRNDTYRIVKKDKEYGRLTINLGKSNIKPAGKVSLSVNLNQLNKQYDAIYGLMKRPSDYQRPLLNLAENYDYMDGKGLDDFNYTPLPIPYVVLTDDNRDGVDKQREFAMAAHNDIFSSLIIPNNFMKIDLSYLFDETLSSNRLVFPEIINRSEIKYIAVTGSLQSMKRKDFEAYIKNYGYELSTNLKKCEFLVNNDIESTSTKNKQAKEYGIPIITEQQFLDSLK